MSTPTMAPTSAPAEITTVVIAPIVFAAIVILALVAVVTFYCCCIRKNVAKAKIEQMMDEAAIEVSKDDVVADEIDFDEDEDEEEYSLS